MSYGVHKWAATRTRARAASSSRGSKSRTARKSATRSARPAKKKPGTLRAAKPRSKSRRATKVRTYVRYDPDTGVKVKVPDSDPRYDEWPSRKPSAKARRGEKTLLKQVAQEGIRHVLASAGRSAASRSSTIAALGGLAPVAGTAAAALAVGALAFWIGRLARDAATETMEEKRSLLAQAFRKAHADLAKRLGRALRTTDPEFVALRDEYKQAQRTLANTQQLPGVAATATGVL